MLTSWHQQVYHDGKVALKVSVDTEAPVMNGRVIGSSHLAMKRSLLLQASLTEVVQKFDLYLNSGYSYLIILALYINRFINYFFSLFS